MSNYKFSKRDGGPIDSAKAKHWMKKWDDKHPDGIKAYFFGTDLIEKILSHPEAVGMRVYFGIGDEDKTQIILIGAREDGSNIWPEDGKDTKGGTIGDNGVACPPNCP